MKRALAQSQAISSHKNPNQISRRQGREEALREGIMRFAGHTHPNFMNPRNAEFLRRISEFTYKADLSELRDYKRDVQNGGFGNSYPLEVILERRGRPARELAEFLGPRYFRWAERILSGPNNVEQRATAERMLKWALEYGGKDLQALALVGFARAAAREMEVAQKSYLGREVAAKRGNMGFLSAKVGEVAAKEIVANINRMNRILKRVALEIGFICGMCAGALSAGEGISSKAIAVGSVAVLGVMVAKLFKVSSLGLRKKLLDKFESESDNGQL